MLVVVEKKAHINFAISITVDERKNRAEISKYSAVHYLLKTTGTDFRGNGKLNFSTESLIFQNKNAIGNLKRDMLAVF